MAVARANDLPPPKFAHFERVAVTGAGARCEPWRGERGTVVWLDSYYARQRPHQSDRWLYLVHLPARDAWKTFCQADLESLGDIDPEAAHLGTRPEISFDLVLGADNDWTEGSYRLPGEFWKVAIFRKDDVPAIRCEPVRWRRPTPWERDASGVIIQFPRSARMGRDDLLRAMADACGVSGWVQVAGPDSMVLR